MLLTESELEILSISIAVFGNILINLGTNLIKYSHQSAFDSSSEIGIVPFDENESSNSQKGLQTRKGGTGSKIWILGSSTFVFGNIFNFIALAFGHQSILAAISSIQFITNIVFASFMLGIEINSAVIIGTIVIFGGNTLIVLSSSFESMALNDSEQLLEFFQTPSTLVYLLSVGVTSIVLQAVYITQRDKLGPADSTRKRFLLPICYALVSAMIGTQSVVMTKGVSSLLILTISGNNQFAHWFTYIVVVALAGFMVFWLKRMNSALRKFDARLIIPLMQVSWILFSIASGGVFYHEFEELSTGATLKFCSGVILIVVGVVLLAFGTLSLANLPPSPLNNHQGRSRNASQISMWTSTSAFSNVGEDPVIRRSPRFAATMEIPRAVAVMPKQVLTLSKSSSQNM